MKYRFARLVTAAALLAGVAATAFPYATNYVSTSAVINAPLIALRSPLNGVLARGSGPPAHLLAAGDGVLEVRQDHPDRTALEELEAQSGALAKRVEALRGELAALEGLERDLTARREADRALAASRVAAQGRRIAADLASARAALEEASARISRNAKLRNRGRIAEAAAEADAAELRARTSAVEAITARLDENRLVAQGLAQGVLTDFENSSDIQQQLDNLAVRREDLRSRIAIEAADLQSIRQRLASERREFGERSVFAPVSPIDGVIWRESPAVGAKVLAGDEVVQIADCSRRFVEVAIPERHFGKILPGMTAAVLLAGTPDRFEASVVSIRGSGALSQHGSFAAEIKRPEEHQMIVVIGIGAGPSRQTAGSFFCDIGRTAEVRFERLGLREMLPAPPTLHDLIAWR